MSTCLWIDKNQFCNTELWRMQMIYYRLHCVNAWVEPFTQGLSVCRQRVGLITGVSLWRRPERPGVYGELPPWVSVKHKHIMLVTSFFVVYCKRGICLLSWSLPVSVSTRSRSKPPTSPLSFPVSVSQALHEIYRHKHTQINTECKKMKSSLLSVNFLRKKTNLFLLMW